MGLLTDWLRNHQVAYPAILFALACVVSIYAGDIKRFLHHWPRRTFRAATRNVLTRQLELLKYLQPGNAYNLLLYLATQFVRFVFESVVLVVIVDIVFAVAHWKIDVAVNASLVGGMFVGTCNTIRHVLAQLCRYDDSVAKLKKGLAELQELSAKGQAGNG